jgi:tetratricopeptide (TPR) repeat protein
MIRGQLRTHLDGILVGPAMVALSRGGIFAQLEAGPMEIQNFHGNQGSLSCVFDLLAAQGWAVREQNTVRLTSSGKYAATLATLNRIGGLRLSRGRLDEAAEIYGRVLDGRRRALGPEHADTLDVMNNLGVVYLRRGAYDKAEPLFVEALAVEKRRFGEDHPKTLATTGRLALLLGEQGRYEEAAALERRTLELREKSLGPTHPATLRSMNNLAVALMKIKRYDEADRVLRKLLSLDEETGRADHPDYAVHVHSLGELSLARGNLVEARRALEKAHDLYKKRGSPNLGLAAFELARVAARSGDRDRCFAWLEEAKASGYLDRKKLLDAKELRLLAADPRFPKLDETSK